MVLRGIGIGVLLLLLIAGELAYRSVQVAPYTMGSGNSEDSPNGSFTADASNMTAKDSWGNSRSYYEFTVHDRHGRVLRTIQIPEPPFPIIFRGGSGRIMWAADSTTVSFGTPQAVIWTTPVP